MLVTVAFLDGQFGFLSPAPRACVTIATANSGTLNQLTSITEKQTLIDTFVGGLLVEADAFQLANGSGTGYAMRINASTNGTTTTVVKTAASGSDGVLAITGNPTDAYKSIIVKCTGSGLVAGPTTPKIQISWDGGITYDAEVQLPVGGVYTPSEPPSGLTFTFTNGAGGFKLGDVFTFSSTAPSWNNTDLTNVLDALRLDEASDWEFFHVVGPSNSAAFAVVASEINLMRGDGRFAWALLEARDQNSGESETTWMNAIKADFTAAVAAQGQIMVTGGYGYLTSAVSGRVFWRSIAWPAAARVTNTASYTTHLGRVKDGPLPGFVVGPDGRTIVSHDERKVPGLAQARFLTVATVIGQKGYFIGDPSTYSPATFALPNSDYRKAHFMRVAMRTARLAVEIGSFMLGDRIEVLRNGRIHPRFAREVELSMQLQLRAQLVPDDLQGVEVEIDKTLNIKTAEKMKIKIIMNSYAYAERIEFTIAFLNPNLVTV